MLPLGMRNAAFVPNDDPDTGTLTAPGAWPAACVSASRTSRTKWPSRATGPTVGGALTNGPRLSSTMCSMFGGRGVGAHTDSATNSSTVARASAGLKRRSCPMVDERSSLIPAPQSEPATWPGITLKSSGSSSSRWRLWKRPSAPSRASTARSGRAAAPTKSESPVRSASPARKQQCSGLWPGVCNVRTRREPTAISSPSASA